MNTKLSGWCLVSAAVLSVAASAVSGQTLLWDFETDDQHTELTGGASGWDSFGVITTDAGVTNDSSGGFFGRFHVGDFNVDTWGMVDVSDRYATRKDLSPYGGLQLDAKLTDTNAGDDPYFGPKLLEIGLGFIDPDTGLEDEALTAYAPAVTLTDTYETYSILFADMGLHAGADLSFAFIKLKTPKTLENGGKGVLRFDEVLGLAPVANPADFDSDGDVDGDDFLAWQSGFGSGTTHEEGDADGDVDVDGDDFLTWQSNFGAASGTASVQVPEPTSGTILALVAIALYNRGRRRTGG